MGASSGGCLPGTTPPSCAAGRPPLSPLSAPLLRLLDLSSSICPPVTAPASSRPSCPSCPVRSRPRPLSLRPRKGFSIRQPNEETAEQVSRPPPGRQVLGHLPGEARRCRAGGGGGGKRERNPRPAQAQRSSGRVWFKSAQAEPGASAVGGSGVLSGLNQLSLKETQVTQVSGTHLGPTHGSGSKPRGQHASPQMALIGEDR